MSCGRNLLCLFHCSTHFIPMPLVRGGIRGLSVGNVMGRKVRIFDVLTLSNRTVVVNRNAHKSVDNRTCESPMHNILL